MRTFPDLSPILCNKISSILKRALVTLMRKIKMNLEVNWVSKMLPSHSRLFNLSRRKITTKKHRPRKTEMTTMKMSCQVNQTTRSMSRKLDRASLEIRLSGQIKGETIQIPNSSSTPKTTKAPEMKCSSSKIPNMKKPTSKTRLPTRFIWKTWRDSRKPNSSRLFRTWANNTAKTPTTPSSLVETKTKISRRWSWSSRISALISTSCTSSRKWWKRATSQWYLMTLTRWSWVKSDTLKLRAPSLWTRWVPSNILRPASDRFNRRLQKSSMINTAKST